MKSQRLQWAWVVIVLPIAACVTPEETESASSAVTATRIYPVYVRKRPNGIWDTRYLKIGCGSRCVETREQPPCRIIVKTGEEVCTTVCTRSVEDCTDHVDSVELFPTRQRAEEGSAPFSATDAFSGPVSEYRGCGPQAAMNFGHYVGSFVTIADAARLTSTWSIQWLPEWAKEQLPEKWLKIGSTPDQLRDGLQWVGDDAWNRYRPTVRTGTSLNDVKYWLLRGYPVALLVNGGYHWQLATGWKRGINDHDQFYVNDYVDRGAHGWRKGYELRFDSLSGLPNALFGFDNYKDATMITFDPWMDPS
jgi:hypothetical protein